jgi:N-acetylmuramoyl-L-alanine amidase
MSLQGKSPLPLRVLDDTDPSQPLSLKEPALYLGASVTWSPASKVAGLQKDTLKASLMLGEPWIYLDKHRIRLSQGPRWRDGRLVLDKASLEVLLKTLDPGAPVMESISAQDLASLTGSGPGAEPTMVPTEEPQIEPTREPQAAAGAGSAAHGPLKRIIIDAGHGGHDPGARGPDGLEEKVTCLDIAKRLRGLIHDSMPGVEVILTRDKDYFVTLRQRTVIANEADADLFVSIHNNASPNSKGRGSQVFFYDSRSSDRAAEDLARRENEDANYLEILMTDLAKSLVRDQSIELAQDVQDELGKLGKSLGIQKRKLSYAPFYVLARTKMPAILVEVAFITNPREEALLRSGQFRQEVAQGIFDGIHDYGRVLAKQ